MTDAKHTPKPWAWKVMSGHLQLEGAIEASDMNPILVARGCGNGEHSSAGVDGCMGDLLDDPLRACPLLPTKADRDLIAAAPLLLEACEAIDKFLDGWCPNECNCASRALPIHEQIRAAIAAAEKGEWRG